MIKIKYPLKYIIINSIKIHPFLQHNESQHIQKSSENNFI